MTFSYEFLSDTITLQYLYTVHIIVHYLCKHLEHHIDSGLRQAIIDEQINEKGTAFSLALGPEHQGWCCLI